MLKQCIIISISLIGLQNYSYTMETSASQTTSAISIANAINNKNDNTNQNRRKKAKKDLSISSNASQNLTSSSSSNNEYLTNRNKEKIKSTSYYNPQRIRNLYLASSESFRLSRSKLEDFVNCERCFYTDRKCGVGRPAGYPFSLNIAVDKLLKREFDIYRAKQEQHPLCTTNNIDAIPFQHENLEIWRDSLRAGLEYHVPGTNILVTGGIDDVWINPKTNELIVVDYKATSKDGEVSIDADWQNGYKRQMEIYQWLFRKNGFTVSDVAYFVYCNGKANIEATNNSNKIFDNKLEFNTKLIPYKGDDSWVEQTVIATFNCLRSDARPPMTPTCDYCQYINAVKNIESLNITK